MSKPVIDSELLRQQIYEAGQAAGRGDPFLASELTESVLHFLKKEFADSDLNPEAVTEFVVKTIRELGQPRLAMAFQEQFLFGRPSHAASVPESLHSFASEQIRDFALRQIFPGNLVAACELGLLELADLDTPLKLAGGWIQPVYHEGESEAVLIDSISQAKNRYGRFVEMELSGRFFQQSDRARWCRTLTSCLELADLTAYVHLPASRGRTSRMSSLFSDFESEISAASNAPGQLFSSEAIDETVHHQLEAAKALIDLGDGRITPIIHLAEADVQGDTIGERIHELGWVTTRFSVAFDRDDQPLWSITGQVNRCPAQLMTVRIHLDALIREVGPIESERDLLHRAGGLVRLAFAAGRAKQSFLRPHGHKSLRDGFLLDRVALIVTPVGLAMFARDFSLRSNLPGDAKTLESDLLRSMRLAAKECSTRGLLCEIRPEPGVLDSHESLIGHHAELLVKRGMIPRLFDLFHQTDVAAISVDLDR